MRFLSLLYNVKDLPGWTHTHTHTHTQKKA